VPDTKEMETSFDKESKTILGKNKNGDGSLKDKIEECLCDHIPGRPI